MRPTETFAREHCKGFGSLQGFPSIRYRVGNRILRRETNGNRVQLNNKRPGLQTPESHDDENSPPTVGPTADEISNDEISTASFKSYRNPRGGVFQKTQGRPPESHNLASDHSHREIAESGIPPSPLRLNANKCTASRRQGAGTAKIFTRFSGFFLHFLSKILSACQRVDLPL